jgi:hypothetical protein
MSTPPFTSPPALRTIASMSTSSPAKPSPAATPSPGLSLAATPPWPMSSAARASPPPRHRGSCRPVGRRPRSTLPVRARRRLGGGRRARRDSPAGPRPTGAGRPGGRASRPRLRPAHPPHAVGAVHGKRAGQSTGRRFAVDGHVSGWSRASRRKEPAPSLAAPRQNEKSRRRLSQPCVVCRSPAPKLNETSPSLAALRQS